jgi:adenylylsulfate reductase subunit B
VKSCPQHAIDVRGYADFAPLGHKVRVHRDEEGGMVYWHIVYRDGREKDFAFPIRTTPWGSIRPAQAYAAPSGDALKSPLLAHEPTDLKVDSLPTLEDAQKRG